MFHVLQRSTAIVGIALICSISLLLGGCGSDKAPDVSGIKVELKTQNLEQDLAVLDTNHIGAGLVQLQGKYPDFLNFYLDTLMGFKIMGNYNDTTAGIRLGLRLFLTNKDYRGLFDTVSKYYPNTKDVDAELQKGFQYTKYYYPDYTVPKVIYLVSGLNNWGAFTFGREVVGVGLDMFLGPQYPFYRSVSLPDYLNTHLRRAYIPVAVFSTVYQNQHPFLAEEHTLLDMMIQKGKEQYFLHHVLPHTADTTLYGYTQAQLEWCNNSEPMIFNFFASANLFYAKEFERTLRYVNDGPNSTGMPAQSPGNIGTWLGYQIVNSYMKQHPDMTMQQLLATNTDAQKFLEDSKYKPR